MSTIIKNHTDRVATTEEKYNLQKLKKLVRLLAKQTALDLIAQNEHNHAMGEVL